MMMLGKTEIELRVFLVLNDAAVELNKIGKGIKRLMIGYLNEIASDKSGWYKLYQAPFDRHYWELSYLDSEMQGGGAPYISYYIC